MPTFFATFDRFKLVPLTVAAAAAALAGACGGDVEYQNSGAGAAGVAGFEDAPHEAKVGGAAPHPVAVGHGAVLYSDGKFREPDEQVLQEMQAHLLQRLTASASREVRLAFEQTMDPALSRGDATLSDPARWAQGADAVDWLLDAVAPRDAAILKQMSLFSRIKSGLPMPSSRATQVLGSLSPLAIKPTLATNSSGIDYAVECYNAGVPHPPPWGRAQWERQGSMAAFFLPQRYTEVYTYSAPEGLCMASAQRITSSDTTYELLAIICQGNESSRACFWQGGSDQTISTTEIVPIPSAKIIGGASLVDNGSGACTDCHAGENAFVIMRPGSLLDRGAEQNAKNWVRPLAPESWPQNVGPGREFDRMDGGVCTGCHNKSAGRRFPRLGGLWGYCDLVVAAMGSSMPYDADHHGVLYDACPSFDYATRFQSTKSKWHNWFSPGSEVPLLGDFNDDGRSDMVTFTLGSEAAAWVALSNGSGFDLPNEWHGHFGLNGEQLRVGDINGDGKDDILTATMKSNARVYAALSTGSSFSSSYVSAGSVLSGEVYHTGDFNGDRMDDIAIFKKRSGADVLVQLSNGSTFGSASIWHTYFSPNAETPLVGDVNGDGYDDIVTFTLGAQEDVWVALSNGSTFEGSSVWNDFFGSDGETLGIADMNGDGMDDIVAFVPSNQDVWVALSTGSSFTEGSLWHLNFMASGQRALVGDVDADHRADAVLFTQGSTADVFVSRAIP